MPVSVSMPRLGESVVEGTVTRWLKQPGDRVEIDEPLLEVSTDKVDTEVPSPAAGVLVRIVVAPDETVAVGTELAVISDGVDADASANGAGYATPLVRRLALAHQVDLSALVGTGAGGRIRKEDVVNAARSATAETPAPEATPPAPGRTERLTRLRALIADRMVDSLQGSAQLTTVVEVDVTRIAKLRDRTKDDFAQRHGVKLSFLPFFVLAVTEALRAHPVLNASIDTAAGTVTYHGAEHVGIAVDTERGLLAPVIRDAGELSLVGLGRSGSRRSLIARGATTSGRTTSPAAPSRSPTRAAGARCSTLPSSTHPRSASWAPAPSCAARWSSTTRTSVRSRPCARWSTWR